MNSGSLKLDLLHPWIFLKLPCENTSYFFSLLLLAASSSDLTSSSKTMNSSRKCSACGSLFQVDKRNRDRQSYCRTLECQRARKAHSQRVRRQRKQDLGDDPWHPRKSSRLQSASSNSQTDWNTQDPLIVGLISMLIGSHDLKEIQACARSLRERGAAVFGPSTPIEYKSTTE